ncbi:hypothetical protein WALSEDRAFT_64316 [Wallemia mellicola CBS 633.66]|nr:hypothetical protein WALSEDRAFT_64316 [Wallemia mellicola CBS 633.66]EIM21696.1 hypothetical protein WALSEDRAFT_64316 [Wallemia mellicola CBS 633.66]|eukprot:XP_006958382.1 hypothetical protein WALSEDRAFT_64316 [Wallemia mellicola CBS 633.66]
MLGFSFVCFAFISFAYIASSDPIAPSSVEYYDKVNTLLQSYQTTEEDALITSNAQYEDAMQVASMKYDQDRIRDYNKKVYNRAVRRHHEKQRKFEEYVSNIRKAKMKGNHSKNDGKVLKWLKFS